MANAAGVLAGLGGPGNVEALEPCITRLRVEVVDAKAVSDEALTEAGAQGVVRTGKIIQVVVGPVADELAAEINALR